MIIIKYIYHDHNNMIMYHGYNFQRQLQATNLAVMKKKKTSLSLYAFKNRRKVKKKNGKRIGRPHTLKFPRLTKDHDNFWI